MDLIEEDILPILEAGMALGLTKPVEKIEPEIFKDQARRGSILSGRNTLYF